MENIWEKYAKVLVEYSTSIKKDDKVIIRAEAQAQPLIKAVYEEVLKKGAHPILRVSLDEINNSYYKYASDEQLDYIDDFVKMEYEKSDALIAISAPYNVKALSRVSAEKQARRSKATKGLSVKMLNRAANGELNWVICNFPTNARAQEAKMSLEEYKEFLINSCYLNDKSPVEQWKAMDKKQTQIAEILNTKSKIRITGEKTDVEFSVKDRKWISCAGKNNFPDGEIFTSPVEDSANGEIYFDFPAIYRGNEVNGIYIKLKDGKVIEAKAEKNEPFLLKMLSQDEGASFVGEVAIGTNNMIQDITGDILFDEKIGGSIHIAFGASYPETGGKNESGLHWDIIKNMKNNGKIYADDELIYKNGKFLIS
ncbi:MAG: aminopeptidase [Candidatus Gastranaerophilales bacterium]|nr:aminopeptidase [Candidatus Gastranaerophilales bacterium]